MRVRLVGMKRVWVAAMMLWVLRASAEKRPKPVLVDASARVGVTTRVLHPAEQRNWRGAAQHELDVVIWYPAVDTAIETQQYVGAAVGADSAPVTPLFEAGRATPHAAFAPHMERLPLVLLAHGARGSALQMAWLGTALARAGYIAAAVDHPGDNASGRPTPEGTALWWERATDLSNVLDGLLKDEEFGERIDPTRVAAAGYSVGGYAVLELAGAQTDIGLFYDRCRATQPNDGRGERPGDDAAVCHEAERNGLGGDEQVLAATRRTSGESLARSSGSFRDVRVKAVFAIAPALAFTQTPESLRAIRVPVMLVVGSEDRIAPADENADSLRASIHGARETTLPGVGHATFLGVCTAAGRSALPQDCVDAPGVDRAAVHAKVAGDAISFFDRALKWR